MRRIAYLALTSAAVVLFIGCQSPQPTSTNGAPPDAQAADNGGADHRAHADKPERGGDQSPPRKTEAGRPSQADAATSGTMDESAAKADRIHDPGPAVDTNPAPGNISAADGKLRFDLAAENLPTSGFWKADPVLVDINEDGNLDLLGFPRLGKGVRLWLGDGEGHWTERPDGLQFDKSDSCGGTVRVADVNHDDVLDIIAGDHCRGIYVYLGAKEGPFKPVTAELQAPLMPGQRHALAGVESLGVGDVNGDGNADLVVGGSMDGGMGVWLGDGTGENWTFDNTGLPNDHWCLRLELYDINKDGHLDIIASYYSGPRIWLGNSNNEWREMSDGLPRSRTRWSIHWAPAIGDVNEDGRDDIVFANYVDGPELVLQQEDGTWHEPKHDIFPRIKGGGQGAALADINQDGHLDIVFCGRRDLVVGNIYGVFLLLGDGTGHFDWVSDANLPQYGMSWAWGVSTGDVNNDGVPDIAFSSGGHVATNPKAPQTPVIEPRLCVWLTRLGRSMADAGSAAD